MRNVRFHGESWRVSGRATEIAKATFMTRSGQLAAKFAVMHNGPHDVVGMVVGSGER
jgi:hypothetical protein